jgi:3-oxoacyl-[acyl-carrier protein] reductase
MTTRSPLVALITGAGRGIGRAIALCLGHAGLALALAARTRSQLDAVADELEPAGAGRPVVQEMDMADPESIAAGLGCLRATLPRIDILVNNAGISPECPLQETTEEVWDRVLAVNLKGQFLLCQAVVPFMRSAGYGRIINIASEQGLIGAVDMSAYCASKAGIFGLTKALARELAPAGILVNCIAPGPVDTAMLAERDRTPELATRIPLGRIGRPEEIAFAVLFLASPQSSWTTGQILSPNGGVVMQ